MSPASHNGGRPAQKDGPAAKPALAAVDLGADSCRVSLLRWPHGQPEIRLVHRFANAPIREEGTLRWDLQQICEAVEEGLRACADLAPEGIAAVGVDGWAVDYVRLDSAGNAFANAFCYRDERTVVAQQAVHARISAEQLYQLTGAQIIALNTLYQLYADGVHQQRMPWLNLPEYILYRLGGKRVAEYTNATHTQLLGVTSREWLPEIFSATGLDQNAAPQVVPPGTDIGRVEGALAWLPAFRETRLIAPACHDTAAAIAGIPAQGDDWAFISSGTWSLVGCALNAPCVSAAARESNFSNEGGIGGRINFLKNVNGMWPLQQCMKQWEAQGHPWSMERLLAACEQLPTPPSLLDVDDPDLLLPGEMPARINRQLARIGQNAIPETPQMAPLFANLIFHSLAARYAKVLNNLQTTTGKALKRLYIVGGGSRNAFLNRLTERASGLKVVTGATESSTIGNCAIQLAALSGQSDGYGVSSSAVAGWATVLTGRSAEIELQPVLAGRPAEAKKGRQA